MATKSNKFFTFIVSNVVEKPHPKDNFTVEIVEATDSEVALTRLRNLTGDKGYYNAYAPTSYPSINSTKLSECKIKNKTAYPNYMVRVHFDNNEVEYWYINEATGLLEKFDSVQS